ncbi:aminotransferase class III-fold pyridoxal phosphate-dependent enzyme [Acidimicrobiaceae bacterium]|jgi:adenosylmethionine-8-amino-7-oxononanoate aminotransferase|nr:aminotransferase class III-fold pyridoxal phosphate-dependent enzyme [Acidimicrobiaceae bacterium]
MHSPTIDQAKAHLMPHFTKGAAWKSDQHAIIDRGEGCYVWDTDGTKYLDGLAGLFCTNMGHGRQDFAAAAMKQMEKLAFFPTWGFSHPPAIEAATIIAENAPGDIDEVFFVNSGSEAVESALKFARNYHVSQGDTGRYKVISREWAYHGTTLGALAVTGIPKFKEVFAPMMWDGVHHVMNTCDDEIPEGGTAADLASVKAIEARILAEGPETVALVIAEPVQNGRGCVVPPAGYWQELRKLCDKYGILLCADEVINAFGRLGHFTGSERFGVVPDMITFAKGVTSAYQPLGGVMIRRPLVEAVWDSEAGFFNHGSTFGGHPVATAVAVANMRAMQDEKVFDNVLNNEDYFKNGLHQIMATHKCLGDVRGTGYFYAVEFWKDGPNRVPLSDEEAKALQTGVMAGFVRDAKVMIRPDDRGATMLILSPPLIADRDVLDDLLGRVDQIVDRVGQWLEGQH